MTDHIIPTPGDYRTAHDQRATIDRIGKRGRIAHGTVNGIANRWRVSDGRRMPIGFDLDIIGPWISPDAELARVTAERDEAVALLRDIARNVYSPALDAFLAKIGGGK